MGAETRRTKTACGGFRCVDFLYVGPFLRYGEFQLHYVMLYPEGAGGIRVFNYGCDPHRESLDHMESRLSASTFTLLIGVNPKS